MSFIVGLLLLLVATVVLISPILQRLSYAVLLVPMKMARGSTARGAGEVYMSGSALIYALGNYKCDHGSYPVNLGDLVPEYISEVPPPGWKANAWTYEVQPDGQLYLEAKHAKNSVPVIAFHDGVWWVEPEF